MQPNTKTTTPNIYDETDRKYQAGLSQFSLGLTPAGSVEMMTSWLAHLAMCPGRLSELATFAFHHANDSYVGTPDPRFHPGTWSTWPWRGYALGFRMMESFWDRATKGIPGLSPEHERAIGFTVHQMLEAMSPTNFLSTNPEILGVTAQSGGKNLMNGAMHLYEDWLRQGQGNGPAGSEDFLPGEILAVTEGKVVYRNDLIELIQYAPSTATVQKEPLLIIPAWIMKYYILDLTPQNSLVKWLVAQGHTVFMVSWKNPEKEDRDLGMDDYITEGALDALDVVSSIIPDAQIHLVGYCLGGTLALMASALIAQKSDQRLKSLSLFAAQADFTEAGEMMVFVTDSEVSYLKTMMSSKGYLDKQQMAGAFEMLRPHDLIWAPMVNSYLMGDRTPLFDLMAWNADATRLPYKMHSEYLERLVLNNELAEGTYTVMGKTIALEDIHVPLFVVGTEEDHVAPWKSVYKLQAMVPGDVTFVLTSGGHNAGIVSEPGHHDRRYNIDHKHLGDLHDSPGAWYDKATYEDGSWWPAWHKWLVKYKNGKKVPARTKLGNNHYKPLCDAPGTYVLQR